MTGGLTDVERIEWRWRIHDGRMTPGTKWHDKRGRVTLVLSYRTFEHASSLLGGVVYQRGDTRYQLGQRRFDRDFKPIGAARRPRHEGQNG